MKDAQGVPVTAASQEAVDRFDKTVLAYLGFSNEIGHRLKEALTADPDFVLARCFKGYLFHLMGVPALVARANKELEAILSCQQALTEREKCHVRALQAWCNMDLQGATSAWEEAIVESPHDILAVKMLHYTHFYMGDSNNLLGSVARVWPAWNADMPGYGYLLSMLAFGYEETFQYEKALELGTQAYELNDGDAWAVHAVAHVHTMTDQLSDGLDWIDRTVPDDGRRWHNFRYHLLWHKAVMLFEQGRYDEVLDIYDAKIWDETSDEYLDLCNNISLLLRLELASVDVGDRWDALVEKTRSRANEQLLAFIDAHFIVPLITGDPDIADDLLKSITQKVREPLDTYSSIGNGVILPLCEGIAAFRQGQFSESLNLLLPSRSSFRFIGGSNAQRELFDEVLIESAIGAKELKLARTLLFERATIRPQNKRTWKKLAFVQLQLGELSSAEAALRQSTI